MTRVKLAVVGALAAFALVPAVANAESVHVVNQAGLSGQQIANFKAAMTGIANDMHAHWGSPRIQWSSSGWTIVFYNRLWPVERICGYGAAGCHGTLSGRPVAVVDTRYADTGRIWSVAGSHEAEEMLVDPGLNRTTTIPGYPRQSWIDEVSDPVEDLHTWRDGVQVADYVYPAWYKSVASQQDEFNWVPFDPTYWNYSCPSGYALYWDGTTVVSTGPLFDGGCTGAWGHMPVARESLVSMHRTHAPTADLRIGPAGNRVAVFPIAR
jgi:hypothetical protein